MDRKQPTKSNAIILHYKKRMYDGGTERELIQRIESSKNDANKVVPFDNPVSRPAKLPVQESFTVEPPVTPTPKTTKEIMISGPIGLMVGLVGILTALTAVGVFKLMSNAPMIVQSREILALSRKTALMGLKDTVKMPYTLIRHAMKK
jgi:hypothetical protein